MTKSLKTKETLWSINDVTMAENGFCSSKLFFWNYHDVWYYHQDITWKENMYKKASFRMWTMWKYYEFYNKLEGTSDKEAWWILILIVQTIERTSNIFHDWEFPLLMQQVWTQIKSIFGDELSHSIEHESTGRKSLGLMWTKIKINHFIFCFECDLCDFIAHFRT